MNVEEMQGPGSNIDSMSLLFVGHLSLACTFNAPRSSYT